MNISPHVALEKSDAKFKLVIKSSRLWFLASLAFVASLIFFIKAFPHPGVFITLLIAAIALWDALVSREELEIEGTQLKYRRTLFGPVGYSRVFELSKIQSFRISELEESAYGLISSDSHLAFDYEGRTHRLGKTLTPSDVNSVYSLLKTELQKIQSE